MRMTVIGIAFLVLSSFVCLTNIVSGIVRKVRKRRGKNHRRNSLIHVLSIAFSIMAYVFARDSLGLWVFIPALVDPATIFLIIGPLLIFRRLKRPKGPGTGQ